MSPIAVRRRIGMVFQKPNRFPKSIYDNIACGPRINGIRRKSELDDIVEQSLRWAALCEEVRSRLGKSALGLSGGQAQRLCIPRTIAVEPDDGQTDTRTGVLVEYGPTSQVFGNPRDTRTQAYASGRIR